jgi:hypothetical protein
MVSLLPGGLLVVQNQMHLYQSARPPIPPPIPKPILSLSLSLSLLRELSPLRLVVQAAAGVTLRSSQLHTAVVVWNLSTRFFISSALKANVTVPSVLIKGEI